MESEWTPQMMQLLDIDAEFAADHLGRGLPVWAAHRIRRRHLCAVRDQCQFGVSVPEQAPAAIARLTLARLRPSSDLQAGRL